MKRHFRTIAACSVLFLALTGLTAYRADPDFFEIARQLEIFNAVFKEVHMNYVDEPEPAQLMNTAIKSMLTDLDPYTTFLSEGEVQSYRINNSGSYSGVGASIRSMPDKLVITEVYRGYPADKAGLKAGDELIEIDGTPLEQTGEEMLSLLQGARNTSVEVRYRRGGQTYTAKIERQGVDVDAVPYYGLVGDHTGYIVLTRFSQKASTQVASAMADLQNQGATQFVLDLRDNPGGLLSEAVNLVNLYVPKNELVVFTRSRVQKYNNQYRTTSEPVAPEVPLAVLINERSASASEIVSGGLQDLDRAVIVGKRSFGKGLVQRPVNLLYGTNLKVTISRYYTSSGRCIQALDYSQRDASGKAVRNQVFNEFKTRNGRVVRDGGGIEPDIVVGAGEIHPVILKLRENWVMFDFCTQYLNGGGSQLDPQNPTALDAELWGQFRKFVADRSIDLDTESEALVREAMRKDSLHMTPALRRQYLELVSGLENRQQDLLEQYQSFILGEIREELLLRQLYREGLYPVLLDQDPVVQEALNVLDDNRKYRSILRK